MPYVSVLAGQLALVLQNVRTFCDLADRNKRLDAATETVDVLKRVQSHLTKFVPRSVHEDIEANPDATDFTARDEDVTVMFLDISEYTAMTELLGASRAQSIVERHFSAYMDVAEGEGGEINEIAGDGLMVLFRERHGANHALRAVAAATAIQASTGHLNNDALNEPPVTVHIGISSGVATVGAKKMEGKAGSRWTFTATGTVTNLAARLVQSARDGEILLSEETARRLDGRWLLALKGERHFKGIGRKVRVFELKNRSEQNIAMAVPAT
jgi:class 3 adenylate cyclase